MLCAADQAISHKVQIEIEEGRDLKPVLKDVEKKLKKNPDSEHLQALKCLLKCHVGHIADKATALIDLEKLVAEKRQVTIETVQAYEDALDILLPRIEDTWSRTIGLLRFELVKAAPKDEEASRACFKACLAKDDYDNARKIANSLEKAFPAKHEYVFWNILMMHLYSRQGRYPVQNRLLYGELALRLMKKLAEATKNAGDSQPLPIRSIQTPQEILLFDQILKAESVDSTDDGKAANAEKHTDATRLENLRNAFLGPESKIAKGEWQLWRLQLELLQKTQSPDKLTIAADLLKRARTKDASGAIPESRFSDWKIWSLFLDATTSSENLKKLEAEAKAHLAPDSGVDKSWRRNASLALVKSGQETRINVLNYLRQFGDMSSAFVDLRPSIQKMNVHDSLLLLLDIDNDDELSLKQPPDDTSKYLIKITNNFKLRYLIRISMAEKRRSQSAESFAVCETCTAVLKGLYCRTCLEKLCLENLQVYKAAMEDHGRIKESLEKTDRHPADDLCILSATCLLKLSILEGYPVDRRGSNKRASAYWLQAAALLEFAWSQSTSNSHILIMLIRIYTLLGCGSLAYRAFKRLSTKQIQHASLSYYMFDGISSTHPHPFVSEESSQQKSVIDEFREHQKVYKNAMKSIRNKVWNSFEHNNYNTVLELEEFKHHMAYNMSAVMSVIESRKISRLTQSTSPLTTTSGGFDILPFDSQASILSFKDTNDYYAIPDFDTLSPLSPRIPMSPLGQLDYQVRQPFSTTRVQLDLFADAFLSKLHLNSDYISRISASIWCNAEDLPKLGAVSSIESGHFLEWARYNVLCRLAATRTERQGEEEEAVMMGHLENLTTAMNGFQKSFNAHEYSAPALQTTLFALYNAYEVGVAILKVLYDFGVSNLHSPQLLKSIVAIKSSAESLVASVLEKSSNIKKSLDDGGWIDKVHGSVRETGFKIDGKAGSFSEILDSLVPNFFLEQWAGEVRDSWEDSVKGFAFFKPFEVNSSKTV